MPNENKKQKKQSQPKPEENTTVPQEQAQEEVVRGERGELGQATAGKAIKLLWHEAHFIRQNVGEKDTSRKTAWVRKAGSPSLRRFARELAKSGNQVAKDWFAHKAGSTNAERTEKNRTRISLEKQASKAARRKKSQKSGGKTDATATATVTTAAKGKK